MAQFNGGNGRDVYAGGDSADQIYGNGGDDKLIGGSNGDLIAGGAGSDRVEGGDGDDTLYSGDQSPPYSLPYYNIDYTLPVVDSGAERDVLVGGSGSDTFFAGYGDTVDGQKDDGSSYGDYLYISFLGATSGVVADFRKETQTIGDARISGVENISYVQGSDFDDDLNVGSYSGNGYSDFTVVLGMGGNDTLTAGYYTGTMLGGDGDDLIDGRGSQYLMYIDGEAGDDILYARDTFVTVAGGEGADTITAHGETHGGAGNDLIIMMSSYYGGEVTGDAGNDEIHAADYSGNIISGGAGRDVLVGGSGDDTLVSGDFGDYPTYGEADARSDVDRLSGGDGDDNLYAGYGDIVDGGAGTDAISLSLLGASAGVRVAASKIVSSRGLQLDGGTITGVETLKSLTATTFGDTLTADLRNARVAFHGGGGNDRLISKGTSADLFGDDGDDVFVSGVAADALDGGAGFDTVSYAEYRNAITVNLATGSGAGGDTLANIENVKGSRFRDSITGSDAANLLNGGSGKDTLDGGAGNDTLFGGAGKDTLTGGTGADAFRFATGEVGNVLADADRIIDFSQAEGDRINLSALDGVAGIEAVDPFIFIGTGDFTTRAGELRYEFVGKDTIVSADTNSDRIGDVFFRLEGRIALTARDFGLSDHAAAILDDADGSAMPMAFFMNRVDMAGTILDIP